MRINFRLNNWLFVRLTGVSTASSMVSMSSFDNRTYASLTEEERAELTPEEIIAHMKNGNQLFRLGKESPHDYLAQQKACSRAQYPAAMILSCIDSRAPTETIMDLGIADCFNARVAGNVANDDIIGSLELACKLGGAKVVLVMGHTGCSAIRGAIDEVQLGNLNGLLAKIRDAVSSTAYEGVRSARNSEFVDAVARTNVELTMNHIRQYSQVLNDLETSHALKIVGAMYDSNNGMVDFL